MKKYWFLLLISFVVTTGYAKQLPDGAKIQPDDLFPRVKMETSVGTFVVELDRIKAPITVNNFLSYVVSGEYDMTIFHRVVPGFVVQGGGYDMNFQERYEGKPIFNESGNGLKNETYSIAMARDKDPHSAVRQFYINLADNDGLDPGKDWGYTVFGMVVEGTEVIDIIARGATTAKPELGWEDVPIKPILLKKATLLPMQ